uniref:Col_cuticle_N domain-containing protein n=1 Tax=Globodera pallida TaxID=36090 RepID=A0A183C1R4_GLOPA
MTYSFAVIIIVLFVLILIAVLFFLIYKICIEHMARLFSPSRNSMYFFKKLTFLCNVSPSDFTGRGQDSKPSFSIATTL